MKNIFIASFDMEVGGVERSLVSMLDNFDYSNHSVDLFLHSHNGAFLDLLPKEASLLEEILEYKTVRQSIKSLISQATYKIALARFFAKMQTFFYKNKEKDYIQSQLIWRNCLPFFPKINKEYDVAISYLWPHNFVAEKVTAQCKIAWIHTDYSAIFTDKELDLEIWKKFDHIISISEDCSNAFINKYPSLQNKIVMIENITAPTFVKNMSYKELTKTVFSPKYFNILSVGRLCFPKAFDKAIKVLHLLHKEGYTNIKWYVVGYGPDESALKELISKYQLEDKFILLGKKNNPYPYMKGCDLYLQPSRYEGKSVTVTEAKILAKPIIVTNYPTAPSQITHGVDGLICDSSIEKISECIINTYKNSTLREQLSDFCRVQDYANRDELNKLYTIMENQNEQRIK